MSIAGDSDARQDDGGESDSSLPSLEALVRQATVRRDNASMLLTGTLHYRASRWLKCALEDPDNSPKNRDPVSQRNSPTLDHPRRETDTDGDPSSVSSSSWPAVYFSAQAPDATWSCGESHKTSPSRGLLRSVQTLSTHQHTPQHSHSARNILSPPPSRRPSHTRPARTTGARFSKATCQNMKKFGEIVAEVESDEVVLASWADLSKRILPLN